jgi:hypothetical protein
MPRRTSARPPAGRADNNVEPSPRKRRHVRHHGVRRGEIDSDIDSRNAFPPVRLDTVFTDQRIDDPRDLARVLTREAFDQLAHTAVPHQQNSRHHVFRHPCISRSHEEHEAHENLWLLRDLRELRDTQP